jgi:hypothetical protein
MDADKEPLSRRRFCTLVAAGAAAATAPPFLTNGFGGTGDDPPPKPRTNVQDALEHPRIPASFPGKFPGRVVRVTHGHCIAGNKPDQTAVDAMVERCLLPHGGSSSRRTTLWD